MLLWAIWHQTDKHHDVALDQCELWSAGDEVWAPNKSLPFMEIKHGCLYKFQYIQILVDTIHQQIDHTAVVKLRQSQSSTAENMVTIATNAGVRILWLHSEADLWPFGCKILSHHNFIPLVCWFLILWPTNILSPWPGPFIIKFWWWMFRFRIDENRHMRRMEVLTDISRNICTSAHSCVLDGGTHSKEVQPQVGSWYKLQLLHTMNVWTQFQTQSELWCWTKQQLQ